MNIFRDPLTSAQQKLPEMMMELCSAMGCTMTCCLFDSIATSESRVLNGNDTLNNRPECLEVFQGAQALAPGSLREPLKIFDSPSTVLRQNNCNASLDAQSRAMVAYRTTSVW